ncbi:MAG: hypothetical protein HQL13_03725 [Candidatus Omnitrophica bacterium]|nr:hypothetical protein [Candidatus Omnitrophota bacterium]
MIKDILFAVALSLVVVLIVGIVHFAQKAERASKKYQEAHYSRLVAEETLQKNDAKIMALQAALKEAKGKIAKQEKALQQEQGVNSDLKKQYDQLQQTKADLNSKLELATREKMEVQKALQGNSQADPPGDVKSVVAQPDEKPAMAGH